MKDVQSSLRDISEIRTIMERSSRFLSLSGLSGIGAGLVAIFGLAAAYWYTDGDIANPYTLIVTPELMNFLIFDALGVFVLSLVVAIFFSRRMSIKKGLPGWNPTAKKMVLHLAIPIAAGAVIASLQLIRFEWQYLCSTMLIFYGLALMNAGKFTLNEVQYLGFTQVVLGLVAATWTGTSFWIWGLGFGILHIVYGSIMYWKYEQ